MAVQEAVLMFREMNTAQPKIFNSSLAKSLNISSIVLSNLGCREDDLTAIDEAVYLCRELAKARPEMFNVIWTSHFASSLIECPISGDLRKP